MMYPQVTTHWITIDEMLPHNWLSKLNHVTAVLYNPDKSDVEIFKQFYGYTPELLGNPYQINSLLEDRIQDVDQVVLLEPKVPADAHSVIQAIQTPLSLVERRYKPSDAFDWHDKAVMHEFMRVNHPSFVLPLRESLEDQIAMGYIGSLLGEWEKVVVQCTYSAGGFHTQIFDRDSFARFSADGYSLSDLCDNVPELCAAKQNEAFLIAPFYLDAIQLCCTAVATEIIELYQVRYPILDGISARGTMPCRDKDLQKIGLDMVNDVAISIHDSGYRGFLNFDLMVMDGAPYLSEINFRIPQGFLYELFLRERPEVNPLWSLYPFSHKINKELYINAGPEQGIGHLYFD